MSDCDLHQLGVLVTRPAHQAEGLCSLIKQAGGRPIRLPVIDIIGPDDEATAKSMLAELAKFDIVIFISANAVHRCYLYIGKELPAEPHIATLGQGSARQLREDFQRSADLVPSVGYNSEALLAMPEFQAVAGKRILILKGEGGRNLLADNLADRGANVSYANLYKRMIPAQAKHQLTVIKQNEKVDVVILTSGEGIANLLSLATKTSRSWLCSLTWLVIHPRLAELARQSGCDNEIIISDGAGDESIITCLRQWQKNTSN